MHLPPSKKDNRVNSARPLAGLFSFLPLFFQIFSLRQKKTPTAAAESVSVVFKAGWNKSSGGQQVEQMGAINYLQENLERVLSNTVLFVVVVFPQIVHKCSRMG